VNESVHESVQDIKGIRLPAAATGLLAGFGVAYLTSYFVDTAHPEPPVILYGLLFVVLPFVVLGMLLLPLWIRKPLSPRDSRTFVLSFWGSFFSLYVVTTILYWLVRT